MASTAADVLDRHADDWGVEVVFGLPGDGINGIMEALRQRAGQDPLRPGAPRGVRRLHGLRLRQIHRQARRLPRHLRARRHPPAQRPLRRQARRPAGAGHHRPALPRPHRHLHAAGRRPRQACSRTSPSTTRASWARPTSRTSSTSPAARRSRYRGVAHITFPVDMQEQPASRRSARSATSPHHTSDVFAAERPHAGRGRPARAPPRSSTRARRSPSSPAAARSAPRDELEQVAEQLGGADRQGAARQGGRARRQPLHDRRHRPARHEAVAGGDGGLRHAAHRRHARSRTSSSTRSPARRGPCRSTSTRRGSACAIPVEVGAGRRLPPAPCETLLPLLAAQRGPRASSSRRRTACRTGGELMEERGTRTDKPMKPQVVARELGKRLRRRRHRRVAIRGTITTWCARQIHGRRGQMFSLLGHARLDGQRPALRHRRRRSPIPSRSASPSSATAASRC